MLFRRMEKGEGMQSEADLSEGWLEKDGGKGEPRLSRLI